MGHWSQVWKALGAAITPLPQGLQLAVGLGAGLLVLAALEGSRLLLFPRRTLERLAARYPAAIAVPRDEAEIFAPRPQPANSQAPRRWQRPQRQRPTRLGSRIRRPQS